MVVQVSERKPGNDDDREPSFESKYMIQTGNYVKFGLTVDTIFRNVRVDKLFKKRSPSSLSLTKNDAFYEIINKKKETATTTKTTSDNTMDDRDQLLHEEDRLSMWIDSKDLYCSCPKIRLRRKYLVMSKASNLLKYLNAIRHQQQEDNDVVAADNDDDDLDNDDNNQEDDIQFSYDDRHGSSNSTSSNSTTSRLDVRRAATAAVTSSTSREQQQRARRLAGLLVDRDTSIVEWRPNYARRLRRFIRYYQSGKCS